jgi:hypothetical protein
MTDNEIRADFAAKLIRRFEGMKMESAVRIVQLMLDDENNPEELVVFDDDEEEDDE